MRKTRVLWTVVALMGVSSVGHAMTMTPGTGQKGSWFVGPMIGLNVPAEDLSNTDLADQGTGFNAGGVVDYMVSDGWSLGVDGGYNSTKSKDAFLFLTTGDTGNIRAKTTNFGVHTNWFIPTGGNLLPYLGAGIGYYSRKLEFEGTGSSSGFNDSDTKGSIGINGGVGMSFILGPSIALGIDARYHWTPKDDYDFSSLGVTATDVKWSYSTFNAALLFHIPTSGRGGD